MDESIGTLDKDVILLDSAPGYYIQRKLEWLKNESYEKSL